MNIFTSLTRLLRGTIAVIWLAVNTLICVIPIFFCSLIKGLFRTDRVQRKCTQIAVSIATSWIASNTYMLRATQKLDWEYVIDGELSKDDWYLTISNHQCYADILICQGLLYKKAPMLKFFLKHALIYFPVIGFCWWALDFPFMKRYSTAYLRNHPEARKQNADTTRQACAKFRTVPTSIFNFVEGTRATPEKLADSQFEHLLAPRAGGIGFTIDELGDRVTKVLDITIRYPDGAMNFWEFLSGANSRAQVHILVREIPQSVLTARGNEQRFKAAVRDWLNSLWIDKDQRLQRMSEGVK